MLEIKDFGMFGQGRTFEVNVRFGRTEQFGLKMAELFGRTECSFEHYLNETTMSALLIAFLLQETWIIICMFTYLKFLMLENLQ